MPETWTEGLSPDLVEKARDELGETVEQREAALRELRKLIEEEPGFEPLSDDGFLLRFLRCRKFEASRAFRTLQNYYAYKARHSGHLTDLTPRQVRRVLETGKLIFSPRTDREGGAIAIFHLGSFCLEEMSPEQFVAAILCAFDLVLSCEPVQVCGISAIFDWSGLSFRRLLAYSRPAFLVTAFGAIVDTWPARVKNLHTVFQPRAISFLYNTFCRPILTKKLRDRMHFHGDDVSRLSSYFPPDSLPEQFGGSLVEADYEHFRSQLHSRQALSERIAVYRHKGKAYPGKIKECWLEGEGK